MNSKREYTEKDKEKSKNYYLDNKEKILKNNKDNYYKNKGVKRNRIYVENRGSKKFIRNMEMVSKLQRKIDKIKVEIEENKIIILDERKRVYTEKIEKDKEIKQSTFNCYKCGEYINDMNDLEKEELKKEGRFICSNCINEEMNNG